MPEPLTPELLVCDGLEACAYLPSEVARLPLRWPLSPISPQELDRRFAAGERRSGNCFYRTECPACNACQPIRIRIADFAFTGSHRRTLRKGNAAFALEFGSPEVSDERVALYNAHKKGRRLNRESQGLGADGYREFLVESRCETIEMRYRLENQLALLAVVDCGEKSLSAVYTYFDPRLAHLSPGTYSILKQIELARTRHYEFLYLGLYVAQCPAMAYKSRFVPHERRIQGVWRKFSSPLGLPDKEIDGSK